MIAVIATPSPFLIFESSGIRKPLQWVIYPRSIGYMGFATVLANILICKSVDMLGLSATLGNVMFASNFLATDILTESYGVKEARKGVFFAIFIAVCFLVGTQMAMLFKPNEIDFAQESFQTLFTLTPRITLASVTLFAISNAADVSLYEFMRKKSDGKKMWLRNNLCTMLCNGAENFFFYFIAFGGVMPNADLVSMAVTATIIEVVVALCDTPFLYMAKAMDSSKQGKI